MTGRRVTRKRGASSHKVPRLPPECRPVLKNEQLCRICSIKLRKVELIGLIFLPLLRTERDPTNKSVVWMGFSGATWNVGHVYNKDQECRKEKSTIVTVTSSSVSTLTILLGTFDAHGLRSESRDYD